MTRPAFDKLGRRPDLPGRKLGRDVSEASGEPVGSLQTALDHAARLMGRDPALAEAQCRAILEVAPGHPQARLMLAAALRLQGRFEEALAVAELLAREAAGWAAAQVELGLAAGRLGRTGAAIEALRRATALAPDHAQAWRALADQLTLKGDVAGADAAYARHLKASVNDPELAAAASALVDEKLAVAEPILRGFLKRHPTDVAAIRMLAEIGTRLGRYGEAENLLARALELAPSFTAARHNYAVALYRQNKGAEAIEQADLLLAAEPEHPAYLNLKGAASGRIGEYDQAIRCYEQVLATHPEQPKAWMSYGHALKTVGRQADSIAAYRRSLEQAPELGEAWWSLANLKTFRFSAVDVAAMRAQLGRDDLGDEDRLHLHFALGKALEDDGVWPESFDHYARGAALRRPALGYDPEETTLHLRRSQAFFTREFFEARAGWGCPAPDPIFVVGLPRAGSTLVEQILASHSQVEGTQELPDLIAMAKRLGGKGRSGAESAYPEALASLTEEAVRELGEEYLERTRVHRKLGRPFFVDKMPNNFAHLGLIHLILPKARIVDARRHPLACCFSAFKQHFARGQGFTYDLTELGRYYADYVALMDHFDQVLPGRTHRVIHETLVAEPEREIAALLEACGLDFEPACLTPHRTERAVRTASSEQVRRPISAEAMDQWRPYEPWLGPLKAALGPVLDAYPAPPGETVR
jgi:tetratricopeptide (TPR) repeat protein